MSAVLSSLTQQHSKAISQKLNAQASISALQEKISRLQVAHEKLSTELNVLRSTSQKIRTLKVVDHQWKGTKRNSFDHHYSDYKQSVSQYVMRTEDRQEQLKEEIQSAQQSLYSFERTLAMLNSQISSLNDQIKQVRRES
ncbi:DUF5082 family protein [Pueribacillus sp. YX66]|uniref:YwqH-like family protein n=1 Tax=Pueribacillus sp. YX66 TaxID=3229242 RepID=UPI00358D1319